MYKNFSQGHKALTAITAHSDKPQQQQQQQHIGKMSAGVCVFDHELRATDFYMGKKDLRYRWTQCTLYELKNNVILDAYGIFDNCYCDGTWESHYESVRNYDDDFPGRFDLYWINIFHV